jgi:hypothetical protein
MQQSGSVDLTPSLQVPSHLKSAGRSRWRPSAVMLLAGVMIALQPALSRAAEDVEPVAAPTMLAASYDVIIVPRPGSRTPRVLTERGWRSLNPRPPQRREARAYQRHYDDRWTNRAWRRPPTADGRMPDGRMPYGARTDWQSRIPSWPPDTWQPQRMPRPDRQSDQQRGQQRGWPENRQGSWPGGGYARAY